VGSAAKRTIWGCLAREFKDRTQQYGRTVRCAGFLFVLWRETEKEAQDECRRIVDHMTKSP
jgi:hypothetical protein